MADLSRLTSAESVHQACKEFDVLGRSVFLSKYGFGKAETYYLELDGRYYDSKAIVGVAFGLQFPNEGVLSSREFYGGLTGAVKTLRKLGFKVTEGKPRYLILAENEISASPEFGWKDVTGERYHFPNSYKNRIRPGAQFIYYRGSRRATGRANPDYFGYGIIGDVYLDPDTETLPPARQAWFAEIADYQEFSNPVPFRDVNQKFIETGTTTTAANYWGTGAREIDPENFNNILRAAGVLQSVNASTTSNKSTGPITPISSVGLLIPRARAPKGVRRAGSSTSVRRSSRAKIIGDRAEQIVCDWLRAQLPESESENIVWVAAQGDTPGYDIENRSNKKAVIGYEVKGTNGRCFPNIEITANELQAARDMGDRYVLVLVALVESSAPKVEFIKNPAKLIDSGSMLVEPTIYRLSLG
jgi:hypothetical protein